MKITDQLKKKAEAWIANGESRYSLAKAADVDYRVLCRWLDEGRDIRGSTIDALCEFLKLDLVATAAR